MTVPVGKEILKGSQVKVSLERNKIRVEVEKETVIEGEMEREVRKEEMVWNLVPGQDT